MLKVQSRAVELLKEIEEICDAEGIRYSLAGRTAAMQVQAGGFTCSDYTAEIMMLPGDYAKFCKAVSGKKDRTIESLETNPLVDGIYARYTDTSTTLLDFKRSPWAEAPGVFVKIWILRNHPAEGRYHKTLETIVRSNDILSTRIKKEYSTDKRKMKIMALSAARTFLRRPGTMAGYFRKCTSDDRTGKKVFYYIGKDRFSVPRKAMENTCKVTFEGITVSAADKLADIVNKNFKDPAKVIREAGYPENEWGVYYDLKHPFAQVIKEAEAKGTDFKRLALERADYDEFSAKVYRKKLSDADRQYKYVWRTINRFRLLEEYEGRTEEILSRFEAGKYDEVREDLAGYIEMIEDYTKINMGFGLDKKLEEIAYKIMEMDGKGDIVAKARKLQPEEYREDLADFLRRNGWEI